MSVRRFYPWEYEMFESHGGEYVLFSDYAALEAHSKTVEENLKEIEAAYSELKERVEDAGQERRFSDR